MVGLGIDPSRPFSFRSITVAGTLIYGLVMLYMNGTDRFDGPYPFFRVKHHGLTVTVIWIIILMAVIGAIAAGVTFVAK